MTQEIPVEEHAPSGYAPEPQEEEWFEDELDETPPRPRRKLLAPVPVTLLVILLTACGFLGGVEIEKHHNSSSGAGLPSGFAALRSAAAGGGGSTPGGTGRSAAGGIGSLAGGSSGAAGGFPGGGLTTGEVSYVSGDTLYVTDAEGNTVKVKAPSGTTVSKTVSTSVHGVHPGDTVVIKGSTSKSGGVTASSIAVSSSSGATSSSTSGASATQQLFGSG